MSTVIGTIKAIIGQAWIVASDGTRRQATEGEQVMRGEQIVTEQGAVTVTLPNGKNLDLGRASHWGDDTTVTASTENSPPQDLAAAQQAIAEGADPSQVLEATAAGNPVTSSATGEAGDGGEGHTHVVLDLTGQILDPTAGYPTDGIDATFPGPLEEETLLETDQDVNDTDDDPIITPEPPVPPVLPEASITIDAIAGDNIINMREAMQETTVVSGKTGHDVRPGDVVTVTVNGNHYQTTVQADGSWSVNVNTSDLLASGDVQASVTTRDDNGNEATASAQSSVGQAALNVEVDIDPIGGDGWINAEEAKAENTTITGTVGGDAKAGDVVHLEVNGKPYEAVVREDLTWSTEVKTADLLADPEVNGTITIKDEAGNEATATAVEPVQVDTTLPTVTLDIDVIAGDGWINAEEAKAENTTITGTVGGDAKAGDVVHLEVNGKPYEAVVREDLTWSTEVKTADLLADPEVNGTITIKDEAGNEATATAVEPVQVDTTLPTVTLDIDVIAGDGWINAEEAKAENTTITGTVGGDAKAGDVVHLEVNGKPYEAVVREDLTWSTEVKTADLLADPEVNGTITIKDEAGNEATATAVEPVQVDTTLPTVTLDIDVIAGDGWINAEEAKAENTTITGTVGGDAKAGDVVHLEVNGKPYEAVVREDLTWSTEVKTADLLADPEVNGTITIKDEAGNEATATAVEPVQVDTTLPTVTLDIDVIAGDGWINAEEAKAENTTITGTVGGDAKAGDVVHLEVNGKPYEAVVREDLTWSTEVKTADLLADPEVNGTITIKDEAGNEATATAVEPVQVDTTLPTVTLDIDVIAGDGWINAEEAKAENTTITGTVGGDAKAGDVVHLEVNGKPYEAVVREDLTWSTEVKTADLLADPEVNGTITIKDEAGNEATATAVEPVQVDTTLPTVTLDIDVIAGDGWINAEEAKAENTTITGTVGGDAKAGDVVHLEVNGKPYEAVVREDLTWSTEVKTADLLADPEVNGTITIKDEAGNEATATAVEPVQVDTTLPTVTLDIDVIAGDGWINAEEAKAENTTITGTVGGDAKAGDVVHLEVNGKPYEAVVREDLTWSTEVKTADLLADPEVNGTITIKDEAGNEATATAVEPVQVDITLPTVTLDIDVIAGDGWINAEEAKAENTIITGTVGGDAKAGDMVVLEVNGNRYEAIVQDDLTWSTEVKTADLLADPEVNGTITIQDEAGNEATATAMEPVQVDITLPTVTLDIDVIAGDGWINAEEAKAENTTITGTVGGDAKAGDMVVLEVNGNRYEAEVQGDLTWSTEVKTADLLADPEVNGTITIQDEAGNEATATAMEPVQVDITLPTVTLDIDVIAGDGWINAEEAKAENTIITGTVGGDAKAGDMVVLEVNGNRYEAEVQGDLTWSTEVKTADLLADPEVNGTITIQDEAGNEATATAMEPVQVDITLPTVTLDIDVIAGDGWINAEEAKAENTTITGTVGGDAKAGDMVVLEVNGNRYEAEVQGDLTWSTEVKTADLLADPEVNGTITIQDEAGNEATATAMEPVQVDITLPTVTLDIDVIAGDGWINAEEAKAENTIITGTVGGDAKAGDMVVLEVNGNRYEAEVQGDLTWSTEVKTADLLADPEVNGTITIQDEAGNEATATAMEPVQVDITLPTVTLDIDVIAGDGWINAEEAKAENTIITGTVGGDAKAGDMVVLEVNGNRYEAEVQGDLTWSTEVKTADLLADPEVNGTITIQDEAGNEATAIDNEPVKIDTTINVVVTIDPVTGDDFLSFSETNKLPNEDSPSIKVTGTVTGEATTDDFVEVKVGDVTIKVPVQDDGEGNLFWEAEFTAENLMKNPEVSASITVQDEAGNIASDSTERPVTIETGNVITGNEYDNVLEGGEGTSDVIIADTQGFQQQPGQDYNIAFIVDSSGSVGAKDVEAIIKSLTQVFNTLSQNAQLDGSGEVNILLVDFDAQVNFAVSVNLTDKNALKTLTDALANMKSGGGTNYEDAFKTAANWFTEMGSDGAENLTYFITDGKPTYYQSNEISSIDVDGRQGSTTMLDLSTVDYKEGTAFSMNIDGVDRVVIDAAGNVYSWSTNRSGNWVSTKEGELYKNGKGGYEISTRAGNGSSTTNTTTSNSKSAFALLLLACDNVEAIGINNGISANDLEPYDSDGNVMAGIAADELANAILGGDDVQMAGAQDTVHGNAGNDILFGDMVLFGNSNGFAAIKEYVAGKLNVDASQLDVSHVSQYISEHPEEFDQSQNDGGKDVLFGGVGDDIIYGGGGDDILVGGSGDDVLFGGKGDDILIGDGFDSSAELASHMGTTVGDLTFDKVADYVVQNSDELGAMGSGNDILHGGEGDDILLGGGGNDILNGGLGDDILYGGTGNDTLTGGKGDDILTGGSGSDTFTWLKGDDGHDVIKDFNAEEGDRIDLSDLLGGITESLENYLQVIDDGKGNAVIEISTSGQIMNGANVSITVEGSSVADINSLLANPDNTSIII